jgi:hypothetical protein
LANNKKRKRKRLTNKTIEKLARDLRQISANSVKAFNDPNSLSAQ